MTAHYLGVLAQKAMCAEGGIGVGREDRGWNGAGESSDRGRVVLERDRIGYTDVYPNPFSQA